MDNLEYLKKVKESSNVREFTLNHKSFNDSIEGRKAIALEIIAEEKIKANDILCNLVTTLENIETTLKARWKLKL